MENLEKEILREVQRQEELQDSLTSEIQETETMPWENMGTVQTSDVSVDGKPYKVLDDIAEYHQQKQDDMKKELFERVFEQEQMVFFQDHRYFMGSQQKKVLAKQIQKMIDTGELFVNQIGQIKKRGSNVTAPKKAKKKRKK